MNKIHITLVGGQPLPVYLGIVNDLDCEKVIYIHSESSLEEAQTIQKTLDKECTFTLCSPTDLSQIKDTALRLRKETENHDVTINITSGTKPWSLIFHQCFLDHPTARHIYIDQLNRCHDLKNYSTQQLTIDIFKRFELHGTPLTKYTLIEHYSAKDTSAIRFIEKARYQNIGAFTDLTNRSEEAYNDAEGEIFSPNGSKMTWNWDENWVEFEMVGHGGHRLSPVYIEFDHAKELVLNTAWFELKTALEINRNPNVKAIFLNCEFLSEGDRAKNEIDIIADFGTRLLFVECKTMIKEITAIDKFRSAMRNFSGTSSTGLFVTNDRAVNGYRQELYQAAMEKCKDNAILTFNFGFWDKSNSTSLNAIIDNIITKTNKR